MFFNASRARRRGTFYSPAGRFSTGGWLSGRLAWSLADKIFSVVEVLVEG